MNFNHYNSSSPVVLPPQNASHYFATHERHEGGAVLEPAPMAFQPQPQPQTTSPGRRFVSKYPRPPSLNYLSRDSTSAAGRKRSRDDIGDELESELDASSRPVVADHLQSQPEQSAMAAIFPGHSTSMITQDFQSGTWKEDDSLDISPTTRPQLAARKSQRTEGGLGRANYDEEIDPIVLQLGIGWKRLADTQKSAIAGSEMFIKKQFQKEDPRILLHHEGLGIYVVRVEPASAKGYWHQWWLFREDLKSCRFLCNEDSDLFRRLSHKRQDERGNWIPDILVEGPEVFARDVPPSPVVALSPANGVSHAAANVEMMLHQQQAQSAAPMPILFPTVPLTQDVEMGGAA